MFIKDSEVPFTSDCISIQNAGHRSLNKEWNGNGQNDELNQDVTWEEYRAVVCNL